MEKVSPKKEDDADTRRVEEIFLKISGQNKEVDWTELKQILDYYTRRVEENNDGSDGEGPGIIPTSVPLDTAIPISSHQKSSVPPGEGDNTTNFFYAILGLVCGVLCKDIVPQSQEEVVPLNTSNAGPIEIKKKKEFSKDVCRSMIAMLDKDRSGMLSFEEFHKLWLSIKTWKGVFRKYDKNQSGSLSGFEMRSAFECCGYNLNNHILNVLMHRYGNKDRQIEFDDFIMCAVKLKTMIDVFNSRKGQVDTISLTMDEWIENTLYA